MSWLRRLKDEEDGQSLLYGIGVIVITVALFYGALDVGLLVLGKIEAQTAADAAALGASGVKAGVHNTRALAYRAASGQAALARIQLVRATGMALKGLVDSSPTSQKDFKDALQHAKFHRENLEALRTGIDQYNQWLAQDSNGTAAVKKAAEIAYRANLGVLGSRDSGNLALIQQRKSLPELDDSSGLIGPTSFSEEAIGGIAGKSHVKVEPKISTVGTSLLSYGTSSALSADATAGAVDAKRAFGKGLAALDPARGFGVNWYTVRLLVTGERGNAE